MSVEMIRMSKESVTRLFVGAIVAVGAGLGLGVAALWAALASDAIDVGGSHVVDVKVDPARGSRWRSSSSGRWRSWAEPSQRSCPGSEPFSTRGSWTTRCGSRRCLLSGCLASAWSR
jgi:hypothetical protein